MVKVILLLVFSAAPPTPLLTRHETSFVVYPADCNHMGSLFGGKIMSEMDRTAGMAVRRFLYASPVKTRAVTTNCEMDFVRPGRVGDLLTIKAKIVPETKYKCGRLVVVILHMENENGKYVAYGRFTFMALDKETGRPIIHRLKP